MASSDRRGAFYVRIGEVVARQGTVIGLAAAKTTVATSSSTNLDKAAIRSPFPSYLLRKMPSFR